jgi:hypothetical protein
MIPNWSFDRFSLKDDATYLVMYKHADGRYSLPHRAYWVQEENKFYSLENNNSHPIVADFWMEIPEIT